MKQHKWHKEIKAWADGAEIETRYISNYGWTNWSENIQPKWDIEDDIEYRIKPQPKEEQYLYVYRGENGITDVSISKPKVARLAGWNYIGKIKLEADDE